MTPSRTARRVERLEIGGDLDRHAVEALHLELRRLLKRRGLEIAEFRIEPVGERGGTRRGRRAGVRRVRTPAGRRRAPP